MPMQVNIVNKGKHPLPGYQTPLSAGVDLRADLDETKIIKPMERVLIGTGLFLEIPEGVEAQVRPRSGLALKHGITVLNTPGTIDADYRGEIKVLLINLGSDDFQVADGDRIAQLVFSRHESVAWKEVKELGDTTRGSGGYGSTGV